MIQIAHEDMVALNHFKTTVRNVQKLQVFMDANCVKEENVKLAKRKKDIFYKNIRKLMVKTYD